MRKKKVGLENIEGKPDSDLVSPTMFSQHKSLLTPDVCGGRRGVSPYTKQVINSAADTCCHLVQVSSDTVYLVTVTLSTCV
jgi:hypothetical protein